MIKTVLLVEDNPIDARIIREYLAKAEPQFKVICCECLNTALDCIRKQSLDVVLLDLSLPDSSGLETFTRLQQVNSSLPILILTGLDDREIAVEAVRGGAQDYLLKANLDSRLLIQSIRYAMERKQIEWQLRKERDKTQKYLEVAAVILLVINSNEEVEMINQKGCLVLGYNEDEIVGKNWFDNFIPQPIRDEMRSVFDKLMKGKKELLEYHENTVLTKCGEERLIAWHNRVLRDDTGMIISILSSGEDITERKKAEEVLKNQNRLNKLRVEILKDISDNSMKAGGKFIDNFLSKISKEMNLSKAAYYQLIPEKEIYTLSQQWTKEGVRIPIIKNLPYKNIKNLLSHKHIFIPGDGSIITKDSVINGYEQFCTNKKSKHFSSGCLIIPYGEADIPTGICVFLKSSKDESFTNSSVQILTELVRTVFLEESKLTAEREVAKLAMVVEQASESIMITDHKGCIEYVNPMFEKITGYNRHEVLGKKPSILKSGEQSCEFYKHLWNTISSGRTWKGTFINRKKDGGIYHEDAIIFPIKDDENHNINYAAVKSDVTSGKNLEMQLRQMQKLEAVGQLAGGIAHDFNNILSVINGFSELALLSLKPADPLYKKLRQIANAGSKANTLVRQLLAFSRRQIIKPEIIDINKLIKGIEKMLKRLIGEDIVMNFQLSKDTFKFNADPGQVEQVLINLIVNARDAINEKTDRASEKIITIETKNAYLDYSYISQHPGSKIGWHSQIIVSDTGIGLDENTKLKIFEPFFSTKVEGKGTGLGLATVYGIVKQNNASIYVCSDIEKGAKFIINWPKGELQSEVNILKKKKARMIGGKETILVAEDEEDVRKFACEALHSLGYHVISAENGQEALKLLQAKQSQVNLLISDVIMPEMGGGELVERINEFLPDLKVIFASGYTDRHITPNKLISDKINFIDKPFTVQLLAQKIREVLDQH